MAAFGRRPHGFLLDSALPANGLGRFVFAGSDPFLLFRVEAGHWCIFRDGRVVEEGRGGALERLQALHAAHRLTRTEDMPPFVGGAVGFLGYEFGAEIEQVRTLAPCEPGRPDLEFGFYDAGVVIDTLDGRALAFASGVGGREPSALLEELAVRLATAVAVDETQAAQALEPPVSDQGPVGFMAGVGRIRDYIASGDVYQVNLAHRYETELEGDLPGLYLRLRRRSPAPYGAYLNFGDMHALSVSPERFMSLRGGRVRTRPIKGTRPRGADAAEDARLRAELEASAKDKAELLMIVDLERNDLGRVCEPGSVRVDELYTVEAHPTVWHLVSEVSGRLSRGRDVFDLLRAAFPGGSITGAPKIRAMQIIAELEPHRRGLYCGSIGWLGFDGDAELNIAIRTIVEHRGRAFYHVGGGITWDSVPHEEYAETQAKARALREALNGNA